MGGCTAAAHCTRMASVAQVTAPGSASEPATTATRHNSPPTFTVSASALLMPPYPRLGHKGQSLEPCGEGLPLGLAGNGLCGARPQRTIRPLLIMTTNASAGGISTSTNL